MLESLRKYWIALLLLLMIGIHAGIVGLIRYQASQAKLNASCEVDLGKYLGYQQSRTAPISMRIHALVPSNQRLHSRQLLELNQCQIRQGIEERLRQIDPTSLTDPYLVELKIQIRDVLAQMIGTNAVEEILITELCEPKDVGMLVFQTRKHPNRSLPVVSSLRQSNHNLDDAAILTSATDHPEQSAEESQAESREPKDSEHH